MHFDIVLCVSQTHLNISLRTIRSLDLFSGCRKIFIITSSDHFSFFEKKLTTDTPVHMLDEDKIIENITLDSLKEIFLQRIKTDQRAGWYFQQFLKMSICNTSEVAENYLIWDSDTLLLKTIPFFDEAGRTFVNPKIKIHAPYFKLMKKLSGLTKQVNYSFISEHFMVRKTYMKELIDSFTKNDSSYQPWPELILNAIDNDNLGHSGFSEFETYGNHIASYHKESFCVRPIKSTRGAAKLFGKIPNQYDIFTLMEADYVFATFESWHSIKKNKIAWHKLKSKVRYNFYKFINQSSQNRDNADKLCH